MRRSRGSLILEEILLIAVSIAVLIVLITIVSSILHNVVNALPTSGFNISKSVSHFMSKLWTVINKAFSLS